MHADGGLDYQAWSRLIDFHLENGTSGIVVGGTTGESATLADAELKELTQRACAQARGRIQVIAGAGTSSTATTVERVRWVSQLPVDGVLIVTPAYNRPTQEGLFRHFQAAAAASRVPLIAYNVPARTAVDMLPGTVGRIAQLPRVAAVKEAVPSVARVREIQSLVPPDFAVLSGDDASARETVLAGARGVISVTANVAPRAMADMIAAALRGDTAGAAQLDAGLAPLHENLFLEANPIPAKWALARMGLMGAGLRLPLTELAAQFQPALERALQQAGVLR
jgi:4-hydroxy-tetrahydrodipicolinate synthase